jgi:secreted protein with Ig-like and vWFA domain
MPVSPDTRLWRVVACYRDRRIQGRAMTNVIVYSFKGYDTAKHRHILRPTKVRSREFVGLMTPSRLQARAKNCRGRWLTVMGFGAQAPNEGRGADVPALTTQS